MVAFHLRSRFPENWDEHSTGILPKTIYCTDKDCWCHSDPRKNASLGMALSLKLLTEQQGADVQDGLIPPPSPFPSPEEAQL